MVKKSLTAGEVIDALGGTVAVARLLNVKSSAVSNWRTRGFPGHVEARIWHECKQARINYVPPAVQAAQ